MKKSNTASTLNAGEISDRVRRAVSESRIPATDADHWADLLAENPSHAELLEQLVSVPEVNANRETISTALSAGPASVPSYSNLSAGDYRQGHPSRAPKLFDAGDLPLMTASGVDVDVLRRVPWQARPAVARAKTHAEVYDLVTKYSGELGQAQADFDSVSGGSLFKDVAEFEERLEEWGSWEATDAEANQLTGGRTVEFQKDIDTWAAEQGKISNQPYWPWADPIDMFKGGQPRRYPGPVERKGK